MDREKLFEEFIKVCRSNDQICGAGNPNAHILLVGQEHYAKKRIDDDKQWKDYLEENYGYCSVDNNPWIKKDENDNRWRNYQNPSKTWYYYQQLINKALPKRLNRSGRELRDFEFDAFTTELNNEAKPSSIVNGKEEREKLRERIEARLKVFKHSDFIKSFPVIILACGGYIRNNEKVREIDDTFHVTFLERLDFSKGNWFCTHYDDPNQNCLVIHTRQLSNGVSGKMIDKMASIIRGHLTRLGLI